MNSFRVAAAAVLAACLGPAAAEADPTVTVSASAATGALAALPARVDHRLTLTAGEAAETVTVSGPGTLRVSGTTPERGSAVPFPAATCEGQWVRIHQPYGGKAARSEVTLTIAPMSTVFVDTTVSFARAPWPDDTLAAEWDVTPASGRMRAYTSPAPRYAGPRGVVVKFALKRRSALVYTVSGVVNPARGGRVTLWGYAPGRKQASRLQATRVRRGAWSIKGLRLPRAGRWEFYARYETAGTSFADDVTPCGTLKRIR